ncbi:MAG: hypothetical protein M1815_003495 [Lichina confinis]|nr:MAG: hypothetical protein M1815_003495 [Lichina confinis]
MKLTFKDLKQQKFVIEAEPTETVAQIKEKIEKEKGWEAPQQKLIYSGKILQDQNTVESYSIEEKGFIVCMVSKPKPAPVPAPQTPAAGPSSTPAPPPAPPHGSGSALGNAPATPSPAPAAPSSSSAATEPPSFNDPSALALGPLREAAVSNMESMGFARPEIDRAMRAAFFNPDRAVEYLLSGIPESVQQDQQRRAPPAPSDDSGQQAAQDPSTEAAASLNPSEDSADQPINLFEAAAQAGRGGGSGARSGGGGAGAGAGTGAGAGSGTSAGGSGGGSGGLTNLNFLRDNSQFQQLRQVVQQQPQMLEPILQQVGAGNPQLAQLIAQNRDQFLQLLAEDIGDDAPLPPGAQAISVTEEERDAIERLCRLGFNREQVIQAYFACDKNEELAANFLFEQPDDAEDP